MHTCLTAIPANLTAHFQEAYLEEAAWYNAAHETASSLIEECSGDTEFDAIFGHDSQTWRAHGMREGLPKTWEKLAGLFEICTGREGREEEKGMGDGRTDGEENETSGDGRGKQRAQKSSGAKSGTIVAVVLGLVVMVVVVGSA
jgi:hypothetical protein